MRQPVSEYIRLQHVGCNADPQTPVALLVLLMLQLLLLALLLHVCLLTLLRMLV
jgi:hypothetical protein